MGEGSSNFTVDEALSALGFGKFQILVLAYAGMGWVSEAMEMMLLSFVGPAVESEWGLSAHQESMITSVVFVGMLVGAYSWGIVSDCYGRRRGFLITATVTSGAGFLSAWSPNYTWLLILRCLVGVGLGGGPVLSSWFLEFIPAPSRGFWMVVFSAFWTLGTIFEASIAWLVMPKLGWRWLLALSSLPSSFLLIFYSFTPESPRYLCSKGRNADAINILNSIAAVNGSQLPPGSLVSDHETELHDISVSSEDEQLLSDKTSADVTVKKKEASSSITVLLSQKFIKSTLLLWVVFFGNAFAYYGLVLLTTELNRKQGCASTNLERESPHAVSYSDVFVTSVAELPGLVISAAIVDRAGRKLSMAMMFFAGCVFLLPLGFFENQRLTTILLFGARICITSTFTVVYIYAPEIYPTSIRTTGVGVASSVGRIGGMICPLVAVALLHGCHKTLAIILFEIVMFASGMCTIFFPFETSGRELSNNAEKETCVG